MELRNIKISWLLIGCVIVVLIVNKKPFDILKILQNAGCLLIFLLAIILSSDVLKSSGLIEGFDWDTTHYDFDFITPPRISHGDKIYLKTQNGKYITSCSWCLPIDANLKNKCDRVLCVTDVPYRSSQFMYHRHRDGTFSLETFDFKWLKRCSECINSCKHVICADGLNPNLQTQKFVLLKNRDGTVSIKTDNDRLMEITECNQSCGPIVSAMGLNPHTTNFTIEFLPKEKLDSRIYETDDTSPRFPDIPLPFPYQFRFNNR